MQAKELRFCYFAYMRNIKSAMRNKNYMRNIDALHKLPKLQTLHVRF